jgi:uncharacterized membrane protein
MDILNLLSFAVGIIGVFIMAWGVLLTIIEFLRFEYSDLQQSSDKKKQKDRVTLRQDLGSYILLSLEFMIAGDIIHTVIKPSQDALIVLGSIVIIRTIISYFLNKELGLF